MKLNKSDIIKLSNLAFMVLLGDTMEERKREYIRLAPKYLDGIDMKKRDLATNTIKDFLYEDDNFCNNGCQVDITGGWMSFKDIKNKNKAREEAVYKLQNGAFGKNRTLQEAIDLVKDVKPYSNSFTIEKELKELSLKF